MEKIFSFSRSAYWGRGHWLVTYPEGQGRVSVSVDGTWSAFDWSNPPTSGITPRPALADGLSTRNDAAIVLRAVTQVADVMERETNEPVKQIESRSCGHV